MSLDNIQFPSVVLQNLYGKSLVDLKTGNEVHMGSEQGSLSYLGNNGKKVAILVTSTDSMYLPDDDLNFLLGILSACKLNMEDIALINTHKNPAVAYNDISVQLKTEKLILFGVEPEAIGLPLRFPHYQLQHFNNQLYISSVSLDDLQSDKEEKRKLWNCLKAVFLPG